MIGSMIISGYNMSKGIKSVIDVYEYYNVKTSSDEEVTKQNDGAIKELVEDTILVADVDATVEQDYYFNDGLLYDKDGNINRKQYDDINFVTNQALKKHGVKVKVRRRKITDK